MTPTQNEKRKATGRTPGYDYNGVDLTDPLWTRRHIGKFISKGNTAITQVLATDGCPSPVGMFADTWMPEEFRTWWVGIRPAPRTTATIDPLLVGATVRPKRARSSS